MFICLYLVEINFLYFSWLLCQLHCNEPELAYWQACHLLLQSVLCQHPHQSPVQLILSKQPLNFLTISAKARQIPELTAYSTLEQEISNNKSKLQYACEYLLSRGEGCGEY